MDISPEKMGLLIKYIPWKCVNKESTADLI